MQKSLFENEKMSDVLQPALQQCSVSRSTFYQGDCLIEMDKIADKSVDMILCDLPYGTTACKWDSVIPFEPLWKHYKRIAKDGAAIVLTATQPFTSYLVLSEIKMYKHQWIWVKDKPSNFGAAKYVPLKYFEDVLVFGSAKTYNPQMWDAGFKSNIGGSKTKEGEAVFKSKLKSIPRLSNDRYPKNIIEIPTPKHNGEGTYHPTQKPVELMGYLIKTYTNEGDTVLDNCMGSGSTGVACKKTGRHFIGIEKDPKYFDIAVRRVSEYCG